MMYRTLLLFMASATLLVAQVRHEAIFPRDASAYFQPLPQNSPTLQQGERITLLLPRGTQLEAALAAFAESSETGALEFAASANYRDWVHLSTLHAAEGRERLAEFAPIGARFLRVEALQDSSIAALSAGTLEEVETALQQIQPHDWGDIFAAETIVSMLDAAFSWKWPRQATRDEGIGWVNAAFFTGVMAAAEVTDDPRYREALMGVGEKHNWQLRERHSGKGHRHADDHTMGQTYLDLYLTAEAPQEHWIADTQARFERVMNDPQPGRVDYDWCDALYMAPPAWARLSTVTGDTTYLNYANALWWDATEFLYDPEWHLFYRDRRFFDEAEANGKPVFWSRGNGWVIAGTVRMLQHIPADYPDRGRYETLLREMAGRLAEIQGADGLWRSSLLYPERFADEPETSGSAFFLYAIAWGINEGILERARFEPVARKAWEGLTEMLLPSGRLLYIQQVGAEPAPNNGLDDTKDYGYGAFMLAATEMIRLYEAAPALNYARAAAAAPTGGPWSLVSNFEESDPGSAGLVDSVMPGGRVGIVSDPYSAGRSKVLEVYGGTQSGATRALLPIPPIGESETGSLYLRFAFEEPFIDAVWGFSDSLTPRSFDDHKVAARIYQVAVMEARDGEQYETFGQDFLQTGTWYECWIVADNASDSFDLYLQGGTNYPRRTLVAEGVNFRTSTPGALRSFMVSLNAGRGGQLKGISPFFIDEVHVASGTNLTRPKGLGTPHYSPWSDLAAHRPSMAKKSAAGWVYDPLYPWVYLYTGAQWAWVQGPASPSRDSIVAWTPQLGWIWMSEAFGSWVYIYSSGDWQQME